MADINKNKVSGSAKRINQAIDAGEEKLQRMIAELIDDFFRSYSSLISGQRDIDLIKAARINEQARLLVIESGLGEVLEAYLEEFPKLQKKSLQYFQDIGEDTNLSEQNLANLSAFATLSVGRLEDLIDRRLLIPLESGILAGVIGNLEDSQIISSLMSIQENFSDREINNFFGDEFNTFSQVVSNAKAEELGLRLFIYSGPLDDVTSKPCTEILLGAPHGVPGLYLKEEINNSMVAGITAPNVFINGAHFNCRHEWIPITLDYAKGLGAKFPRRTANKLEQSEAI